MMSTGCQTWPLSEPTSWRICSAPPRGGFSLAKPDGFRLDAVKHLPLEFWARFNRSFELFRLGELLDGDAGAIARTWREGHFSSMFDFPLGFAIVDVFCRGQSPAKLAAVLTNDRRYPDPSMLVTLVDNHDLPRILSQCGGDVEKTKQALSFLLAMRGIPSLAWGTEVGLEGAQEPENRPSMRFVPHPLVAHITEWMHRRAKTGALRDGAVVPVSVDQSTLVLARVAPDGSTLHLTVKKGIVTLTQAPPSPSPAALHTQWRTGARTKNVCLTGTGLVVGSGPELGDWDRRRARPLPLCLELPEWGVFEYKRIVDGDWEPGENHILFVDPRTEQEPAGQK